mmetsp:Transcript_23167/g.34757  ORF Transcript_23167/g.34757 Transcript_23167/m.34757 type:complete len:224 (-) Transcript_23167:154-825(-)
MPRTVVLGKGVIVPYLATHWALKIGDTWYEVPGASKSERTETESRGAKVVFQLGAQPHLAAARSAARPSPTGRSRRSATSGNASIQGTTRSAATARCSRRTWPTGPAAARATCPRWSPATPPSTGRGGLLPSARAARPRRTPAPATSRGGPPGCPTPSTARGPAWTRAPASRASAPSRTPPWPAWRAGPGCSAPISTSTRARASGCGTGTPRPPSSASASRPA